MRNVKITRSWPYSLDGNTVQRAEPDQVVNLPDELADAAIKGGFGVETKVAPPPPEAKDDEDTPGKDDDGDDEADAGAEPGNDGKTVPENVKPKRKRNR